MEENKKIVNEQSKYTINQELWIQLAYKLVNEIGSMPTTRVLVKAANIYRIFKKDITTIDLYIDFKGSRNPIIEISNILEVSPPSTCIQ